MPWRSSRRTFTKCTSRKGLAEYTEPVEFFRRTYLTVGLRQLLTQAAQRITHGGGVPVVDLQTNFGGGKTHSMIALYHLFSGLPVTGFPQEVQELLSAAGVKELPAVRRAVVVGYGDVTWSAGDQTGRH